MKFARSALFFSLMLAVPALAAPRLDGLSLEAEPAHVSPADVQITVHLQNVAQSRVVLDARPIWNADCGLTLTVQGPTGKPRQVPDEDEPCRDVADTVEPGTSLAVSRTLMRDEWFPSPGRYTLRVRWKEPGKGLYEAERILVEIGE